MVFDLQAYGVRPRSNDGANFGRFGSPVGNWARIGIAEARFIPDVRIVRGRCPQRDQSGSFIAQVPWHAIHARTSLRFELSDHLTVRVEDLKLDRIFRRGLE